MSFGTTYFTPAPMGREIDFGTPSSRQGLHQRTCSGGAYTEEMFMVPKLGSDPRDFYVEDNKELDSAGPGAKQPRDRMRLNKILNSSEQQQQQQQNYPYHDNSPTLQSFHTSATLPTSFSVSPVASLSPMTPANGSPVPAGMAPALVTMSSPMTSFPTMSQPNLIFEDVNVMPYSYNLPQYHTAQAAQGAHSPQHHHAHYGSQSPDPSGSPSGIAAFPQRAMNSLVDHHHPYSIPDSPPSLYHAQNQMPSPYSVGSHSPINGSYSVAAAAAAYASSDAMNFTPTPPATPHYGFSGADGRYPGAPMSMYGDHFALQAQPAAAAAAAAAAARSNRPGSFRGRKAPYEPRTPRSGEQGMATGVTPPPRRFQCPECDKAFPTKGELASHSRCHLKVPAFICGICGRPFKRRTDYVRHVRNVHEEVGRYGCAQCGERFGRLDKLKRHDKRGCHADKEEEEEQQFQQQQQMQS